MMACVLLLAVWTAAAQSPQCHERIRRDPQARQLYAGGAKMSLRVQLSTESIALTVLTHHARERVEVAGVYAPGAGQHLKGDVTLSPKAFTAIVSLRRQVDDLGYGVPGIVSVWLEGIAGTHKEDAHVVLRRVRRYVEDLLAKYVAAQRICGEET